MIIVIIFYHICLLVIVLSISCFVLFGCELVSKNE